MPRLPVHGTWAGPKHEEGEPSGQGGTAEGRELPAADIQQRRHQGDGAAKKTDSAEVYIGDEFVGIVFLDDEDGDRSYSFTMSILDTDLD